MDKQTLTLLLISLSLIGLTMIFSHFTKKDKVSKFLLRILFILTILFNVFLYIELITSKL